MVDVQAHARFLQPISLKRLRIESALKDMALLRPGQRLSIQPVSPGEWKHILQLEAYKILS